jgi:hypothetical protein
MQRGGRRDDARKKADGAAGLAAKESGARQGEASQLLRTPRKCYLYRAYNCCFHYCAAFRSALCSQV